MNQYLEVRKMNVSFEMLGCFRFLRNCTDNQTNDAKNYKKSSEYHPKSNNNEPWSAQKVNPEAGWFQDPPGEGRIKVHRAALGRALGAKGLPISSFWASSRAKVAALGRDLGAKGLPISSFWASSRPKSCNSCVEEEVSQKA